MKRYVLEFANDVKKYLREDRNHLTESEILKIDAILNSCEKGKMTDFDAVYNIISRIYDF